MEETAYAGRRGTGAAAREAPPEGYFERMRAPFVLRCGALLVDYTVLVALLALATLLARTFEGERRWGSATLLTAGYLVVAGVALLNFVVVASWTGRTLGKWVTGLRIERVSGEQLGFGRALLRHSAGYLLTMLTGGLGFLAAAFNSEGRSLHDLVAGTVVVRGRRARGPRLR